MADPGADAVPWPDDAIEVGIIIDAWGVKGWFKVKPFAADPQALFSSKRWLLKPPESIGPRSVVNTAPLPPLLKIVTAKDHGDLVVAQAQDIVDRPGAETLRGARVYVPRCSFPTAP
ncbi:MAG: ribosome maturation factor RimM, partial [Burkholderiaceae bacterium]|nr:ribosome maturation factor RimM [Burkholderiaceae bacterium]